MFQIQRRSHEAQPQGPRPESEGELPAEHHRTHQTDCEPAQNRDCPETENEETETGNEKRETRNEEKDTVREDMERGNEKRETRNEEKDTAREDMEIEREEVENEAATSESTWFPKNQDGRSFQGHWYDENPWLEYSPENDAMYCFSCRISLNDEKYKMPESSKCPSDASSASAGSYAEDLSFPQANNSFCGSYLAELESTDICNNGMPMYNSSPYHTRLPSQQARNAPETPRRRFHRGESSQVLKDIAANKNTTMLTELLMEVKQMSRDIQFLKTEITDLRSTLNSRGAEPDSQREEKFPIVLPLTNEEQFDEAEAALKEETVRRKMISRLALVGGTNSDMMIRRMLSSTMTNSLACLFNWAGKGQKRAFKDTLLQNCMFAAVRQFDRKLLEFPYSETVKKWLRYAPERSGGVPRKEKN
ncbi:uncharacterized protein LOC125900324 [Epinephelus fuscoguttatus]|uniref:uncharacterized protein LOC125900324 n=1 Tax=Epinephelus fuscoguttatus TaxID=293821 RepID=UPI0020CFF0DA|nr:uncharacterized protein LOC125900324 [Epinephelus fuscoguttatus]